MCFSPKVPATPPPVQFQPMLQPKDMVGASSSSNASRRRGLYASIFTSPRGVGGAPTVTGTSGGTTGG